MENWKRLNVFAETVIYVNIKFSESMPQSEHSKNNSNLIQ